MIAPASPRLPLAEFYARVHVPRKLAGAKPKRQQSFRTSIEHLRAYLEREPDVEDLAVIEGVMLWLIERGRANRTINRTRCDLLAIARTAVDVGQIEEVPYVQELPRKRSVSPWSVDELAKLIASARSMPGQVGSIAAGFYWPAVVVPVIDLGVWHWELINAPKTAYRRLQGQLALDGLFYPLHPLSQESLDAVCRHPGELLLPWPLDRSLLYREFRKLLYRANLSYASCNLFRRLQVTARAEPAVLDRVRIDPSFIPREGMPRVHRARGAKAHRRRTRFGRQRIVTLQSSSVRSLETFFETQYRPRRLLIASWRTVQGYRVRMGSLQNFTGHQVTLDELSDDLLNDWKAWLVERGYAPATVNGYIAAMLALWRYAWTRKLVDELPRDVTKLPEPRRIPEAWDLEELGRILDAAAAAPGSIGQIPAHRFWPAFILTAFYTGLRLTALLSLRVEDLDFETGKLFVRFSTQKHRADQVTRLKPDALDAINATHPEGRDLLFPVPSKSYKYLGRRYQEILRAAGLPQGSRDLFHKLRRTHATYCYDAAGEDFAVASLDHSSRQVARKSYFDFRKIERGTFAADVLPSPAWCGTAPSNPSLKTETSI